MGRLKKT